MCRARAHRCCAARTGACRGGVAWGVGRVVPRVRVEGRLRLCPVLAPGTWSETIYDSPCGPPTILRGKGVERWDLRFWGGGGGGTWALADMSGPGPLNL